MAITITYQPNLIMPAYNPVVAVLTSDNDGEDKFRFVTQIMSGTTPFASGSTVEIDRLRTVPDLNGNGIVRMSDVLKQYVDFDLSGRTTSGSDTFTASRNPWLLYHLRFGEEYLFKWVYDDVTGDSDTTTLSSSTETHIFSTGDRVTVTQYTGTQFDAIEGVSTITKLNDNAIQISTPFESGSYTGGTVNYASQKTTQFLHLNQTEEKYVSNISLGMRTWNSYDFDSLVLNTGSTKGKLFTDFGDSYVNVNDSFNANAFSSGTTYADRLVVSAHTGTSIVSVAEISNGLPSTEHQFSIGIGPKNLNDATLLSGAQPVITDSTTSYTVHLEDDSGNITSETLTFNIEDDRCTKFDIYKFVFLNKWSSWNNLRFTLRSRLNISKKQETYDKQRLAWDGDSFGFNDEDRGETVNYLDTDETITVFTDWLREKENSMFKEMMESPEVYHEDGGNLRPIIIQNTNWEQKKKINENLIQYSITFRYASKDQVFNF